MQWETFAFREEIIALTKEGKADAVQAVKNWGQLAGYGARKSWDQSRPTGSVLGETVESAGTGALVGAGLGAAFAGKGQRRQAATEGAGIGGLAGAIIAPATTMLYRAHPHWSTHAAHMLAPDLVAGGLSAAHGMRRRGQSKKMQELIDSARPDESPVKEAALGPDGRRNLRHAKQIIREAGGITAGMGAGYVAGSGLGHLLANTKLYKSLPVENKRVALGAAGALVGGAGTASASVAKRIARAQDRRERKRARTAARPEAPGEQ